MYVCSLIPAAHAQVILPGVLAEYINPTIAAPPEDFAFVTHLSNYHLNDNIFSPSDEPEAKTLSNLYVWAWSNYNVLTLYGCGFGWKWTKADGTIIDDGYLPVEKLMYDPEIALLQSGGTTYIVLAYYRSTDYLATGPAGHFYDIYKWSSTGPVPYSLDNQIGSSQGVSYGRISIDAVMTDKLVITWQDTKGIMVKAMKATSGVLAIGNDRLVTGMGDRIAPDVAISFVESQNKDLVYLLTLLPIDSPDARFFVDFAEFNDIFTGAGAITFTFDNDDRFAIANLTAPEHGYYHQIDCPDRTDSVRWAYTYRNFNSGLTTILPKAYFRNGSAKIDLDLDEGYFSYLGMETGYMTVTYDHRPEIMHFGFFLGSHSGGPVGQYYAVTYDDMGAKQGALTDFKAIKNASTFIKKLPNVAFSKNNELSKEIYTSYTAAPTSTGAGFGDLRHKHVKYIHSTFNLLMPFPKSDMQASIQPNPSNNTASLHIDGIGNGDNISIEVSDMAGRLIYQSKDQLAAINTSLSNAIPQWAAGVYLIQVQHLNESSTPQSSITLKFIKQ